MQKENLQIQKNELRQRFIRVRNALASDRRLEASSLLMDSFGTRGRVLSFAAMRFEIDTSLCNQLLAEAGCLFLNRLDKEMLVPYYVADLKNSVQKTSLGFIEPNPLFCRKADLAEIDLILVPGLGFDGQGYRLGYGKGYYDRFLSNVRQIRSVGIGFREQFSDLPLPREPWDIPVDELFLV